MKRIFVLTILLSGLLLLSVCQGQQNTSWDKWTWLMGEWIGEGSGQPGQGGGTFSFSWDLDRNIIVRKSHSEYPAAEGRPAIIHDDLMIVWPGAPDKAVYFDNEGHTIFYTIAYSDKSIIMTSEKSPDAPVFRLVYTLLSDGMVNTKFEMSGDGITFSPYIEGKSKKKNPGY